MDAAQTPSRESSERQAGGRGRAAVARTPGQPGGAAAAGTVRRGGRGAQTETPRRPQSVRSAVVRHHRRSRVGQDDGPGELRAALPARTAHRQGLASRHRRHPQLRLVVHRRGHLSRHRGSLHDTGFRRRRRQRGLVGVPGAAPQVPQAPARERRHPDDQRAGSDAARAAGARGTRGRRAAQARRAQSRAAHSAARLSDGDQVRSGRRLRRVLRRSHPGRAHAGLGRHVPVCRDAERQGGGGVSRGVRRPDRPSQRATVRASGRRARQPPAHEDLCIPAADGGAPGCALRICRPRSSARPGSTSRSCSAASISRAARRRALQSIGCSARSGAALPSPTRSRRRPGAARPTSWNGCSKRCCSASPGLPVSTAATKCRRRRFSSGPTRRWRSSRCWASWS